MVGGTRVVGTGVGRSVSGSGCRSGCRGGCISGLTAAVRGDGAGGENLRSKGDTSVNDLSGGGLGHGIESDHLVSILTSETEGQREIKSRNVLGLVSVESPIR